MKTSATLNEIANALLKAQKAIKFALADATNPHFRSRYADLPSVIDAIKEALNDAGIVFVQTPSPSDERTLALTTRLLHISGEWIEDTAIVPLPKSDPQGYGSALTYARRYSLAAITGLYQDDDDGNAATPKPTVSMPTETRTVSSAPSIEFSSPPADVAKVQQIFGGRVLGDPAKLASAKQVEMLRTFRRVRKVDDAKYRDYLLTRFSKERTEELTNAEVSDVVNWVTKQQ